MELPRVLYMNSASGGMRKKVGVNRDHAPGATSVACGLQPANDNPIAVQSIGQTFRAQHAIGREECITEREDRQGQR